MTIEETSPSFMAEVYAWPKSAPRRTAASKQEIEEIAELSSGDSSQAFSWGNDLMKKIPSIEEWANRNSKTLLIMVLFSAVLIRLYGIDFGLPYLYDPDEPTFVGKAGKILEQRDLNPHWFGAPATTTIYMLSLLYIFIYLIGLGLGIFANPTDFKALYLQDPTVFYLSGRVMSTVFGVAAILLTYLIAHRLFNRSTGLLAATFLALSPLHVYYSKLVRMDVQMGFLMLVVFWFCLEILSRRSWVSYILAGFFTGLGIATKYPAAMGAPTIVIAHILSGPWHWRHLSRILVSGIASLIGVFVASPFLLLDFETALSDISKEARLRHLSGTGEGLIQNLSWYLQGPLLEAVSIVGFILAAVGLILCIVSREKRNWLLIAFPVCFILFIASLNLRWDRWIIPAIPFLCILAAHALYWTATWSGERWEPHAALATVFLLLIGIVAPLLKADIGQGREMTSLETRTLAREWMMENIPAGSRILLEEYTPQFSKEQYKFLSVDDGKLVDVDAQQIIGAIFVPKGHIGRLQDTEAIHREKVEYMVHSNIYERYIADSKRYPDYAKSVETYETLVNLSTKIYEVKRVSSINFNPKIINPTISIYRFNSHN